MPPSSISPPDTAAVHQDTTAAAQPKPRRSALFWWLAATQVVGVLSLGYWLLAMSLAPTMEGFDYGFTEAERIGLIAFLGSYPLVLLACGVLAWRARRGGRTRLAVLLSLVPLLHLGLQAIYVHSQTRYSYCCG